MQIGPDSLKQTAMGKAIVKEQLSSKLRGEQAIPWGFLTLTSKSWENEPSRDYCKNCFYKHIQATTAPQATPDLLDSSG